MDSHLESLYPANSREKEIEQIISFVKEGNSCQVIAAPGVGRGNILGFLAYNHAIREYHLGEEQDTFHFVMVNFSEVKNRPLLDIIKFLFLELTSSLHERKMSEEFTWVDALFKESLSYQDELVLFQGLKKAVDYLTLEKKLTVVLLFERFETYIPQVSEQFFTYLRSLRNRAKYKFSVVLSVTRPLEEVVEPLLLSDFYEFLAGHIVYLALEDKPGILFRIHYLEQVTKKTLSQETIDQLLALTAGHGKLTRLGTEALLAQNVPPTQKFLLSQKTIQGALFEIWYFLTPAEKTSVRDLVLGKTTTQAPLFLEKIELVTHNSLTIPLLASFVQEYEATTEPLSEKIYYDMATNTIKKGSTIISEKLTAAEFRLLLFLLENQGKVLERDTIIDAVWKNQASTIGVTDQALDQLIFRLRKQIEPNPNKPIYIQTIKGRGVRFSNENLV